MPLKLPKSECTPRFRSSPLFELSSGGVFPANIGSQVLSAKATFDPTAVFLKNSCFNIFKAINV